MQLELMGDAAEAIAGFAGAGLARSGTAVRRIIAAADSGN
jgi:hypothetical protein